MLCIFDVCGKNKYSMVRNVCNINYCSVKHFKLGLTIHLVRLCKKSRCVMHLYHNIPLHVHSNLHLCISTCWSHHYFEKSFMVQAWGICPSANLFCCCIRSVLTYRGIYCNFEYTCTVHDVQLYVEMFTALWYWRGRSGLMQAKLWKADSSGMLWKRM